MIKNKQVILKETAPEFIGLGEIAHVLFKSSNKKTGCSVIIYLKPDNSTELVSFCCISPEFILIGDVVVTRIVTRDPKEVVSYIINSVDRELASTTTQLLAAKVQAKEITSELLAGIANATKH